MNSDDIKLINTASRFKESLLLKNPFVYFMRAVMAGFFIDMAVILCNVTNNIFYDNQAWWGKLIGSLFFGIAIMLIVNIGGELFTGNNMVMAFSAYKNDISWTSTFKVWAASYIGNLVGCTIFAAIFVLSGASGISEYLLKTIEIKLLTPEIELFFKAILCNFFVCASVLCGMKMKSECGKIIMIFLCIGGFVFSGFEHAIANMGTFSMAYILNPTLNILSILHNLFIVTVGNIAGGAILFAWPLRMMSFDK